MAKKKPEPEVKAGRPLTVAGRRRNIYIDDDTAALAERLGGGNMSEGIRKAVLACKGMKL